MRRGSYQPKPPESPGEGPLFLQIARQIAHDIQTRVLRPGARLPGSRELSRGLGVHRNTALAALAELISQGWLQTQARRGTFVSDEFPETRTRRFAKPAPQPPAVLDLPEALPPEPFPSFGADVLPLVGGTPDVRLVPVGELSRAYRRALARCPSL
jgi:GntR family transcriptional regulator/MocR family aminotransferase